jgi:pimeloyl-ACP methyl ester carboxylesterase
LGNQVPAVAAHHTVILMDSRGHGRSTRDARPYGYDLMADDVVALMDVLKIPKADTVDWSDGGILGIDLAMRHKDRVGKVFAFAANTVTSGVVEGVEKNTTFAAYIDRAGHEYAEHSATPKEYDAFVHQISRMWADQPTITGPTISSRRSTRRLSLSMATIPHAGLLILPNARAISPSCRTPTSSISPSCISWATNRDEPLYRAGLAGAFQGVDNREAVIR